MTVEDLVGQELVSPWLAIEQARIDEFARATDDPQWIHTDPERAAAGPFGTTIAHGFLTLSLVVPLFEQALPALDGYGMTLNYGLNRVRFTSPVPVGAHPRPFPDRGGRGRDGRQAGPRRRHDRARGTGEAGLRRRGALPWFPG